MIINLIGPPCAGKSTFAGRYVLEHPEYTFCSIDSYRFRYGNEDLAWAKFQEEIVKHRNVIVESCGLSYRLKNILNSKALSKRKIVTVYMYATVDTCISRLKTRIKRTPDFEEWSSYNRDEAAAITYALSELPWGSCRSVDITLGTHNCSPETVYNIISEELIKIATDPSPDRKTSQPNNGWSKKAPLAEMF